MKAATEFMVELKRTYCMDKMQKDDLIPERDRRLKDAGLIQGASAANAKKKAKPDKPAAKSAADDGDDKTDAGNAVSAKDAIATKGAGGSAVAKQNCCES